MKKTFFTLLFLTFSLLSFSQTFVRKYTSVITKINGVMGDWKNSSLTVVFNEKNTDDIVFYYADGTSKRFHQISNVFKDKTRKGESYQILECIDDSDGVKVAIQLFDDDSTLRILIDSDTFVEFHND